MLAITDFPASRPRRTRRRDPSSPPVGQEIHRLTPDTTAHLSLHAKSPIGPARGNRSISAIFRVNVMRAELVIGTDVQGRTVWGLKWLRGRASEPVRWLAADKLTALVGIVHANAEREAYGIPVGSVRHPANHSQGRR
jgi:hypothetical protein